MSIRRRLALLVDPSLGGRPDPYFLRWNYAFEENLKKIAASLDAIEKRTKPRKGRNVWCEHPELHPEVELVS